VWCWHGYLSGARCRLAYGPADAAATLGSVKSRLVLPYWYRVTRVVPDKGPFNGCVCQLWHLKYLLCAHTRHTVTVQERRSWEIYPINDSTPVTFDISCFCRTHLLSARGALFEQCSRLGGSTTIDRSTSPRVRRRRRRLDTRDAHLADHGNIRVVAAITVVYLRTVN